MFIHGEYREDHRVLNAFPCFICKKMIINAGLRRVVCSIAEGDPPWRVFRVEEWIRDWQTHDIIDDRDRYRG
jgi:dCMP deaminase